jgi:hypothetical protein
LATFRPSRLIFARRVSPVLARGARLTLAPRAVQLKDLLETPGGGDWERKNRLKVYEGVFAMATRDFRKAATLFLDSLSTFTATELCSYNQFVFYTVVTAMVALDRVSLKKRVVDTPEILAVLGQLPHMESFLNGLYGCKYKARTRCHAPPRHRFADPPCPCRRSLWLPSPAWRTKCAPTCTCTSTSATSCGRRA